MAELLKIIKYSGIYAAGTIINRAVSIDNERYIASKPNGTFIEAEAEAESILSLLHTIDDFLSCVSLAKKSIEAAEK